MTTECAECGLRRSVVFKELLRQASTRVKYTDRSLCPACLRKSEAYKSAMRRSSKAAAELIKKGGSERSKLLWEDPTYRASLTGRIHSDETRTRISGAVRSKMADPDYMARISAARRAYWEDEAYRSARSWDLQEFVRRSRLVHGDTYDYGMVEYNGFRHRVTIVCRAHGEFRQLPGHHIHFGNGCPVCSAQSATSAPERSMADWLESVAGPVLRNDRDTLGGLELDMLLPERHLALECNGCYWHSYCAKEIPSQRYRHHYKSTLSERAGISLLQFTDLEWLNRNEVVKSMVLHRLGESVRVGARSCTLERLDEAEASRFFESSHLSGHRHAAIYCGLCSGGKVLMAASFSRLGERHELIRCAAAIGVAVIGGLSRLLSFSRAFGVGPVFTYADRRYSNAAGYKAAGFSLLGITPPGYKYFKGGRLYSRQRFQKHKLPALLGAEFDSGKTEAENLFAAGYRRMWDAGHYRLERT